MNSTYTVEQGNSLAKTKANVGTEISRVSVAAIVVSAGVIGCWATACLFAGTLSSGGPSGLISHLVKAIIG